MTSIDQVAERSSAARLYDEDYVAWVQEQAAALREAARSRVNLPIDWDNLIEEVEGLAQQLRNELGSRVSTIIEHLIKLECSPSTYPRQGWRKTIRRERSNVERLLEGNRTLVRDLPSVVEVETRRAAAHAAMDLEGFGEASAALLAATKGGSYAVEQVLGDWLPDGPGER